MQGDMFELLSSAKDRVDAALTEGIVCPCCGQFSKMYRRKLNNGMAWSLIQIAKYFSTSAPDEWLHVERYLKSDSRAAEISKLRFWGLLEDSPQARDDGCPHSGFWKITQKGRLFVSCEIRVPSHVFIFNNTCYGHSETDTDIRECLGDRFNYEELMAQYFERPA